MSSTTKPFEEKMNASVNHLVHELASIRAGRANPAILDKVAVDYYGSPTPIQCSPPHTFKTECMRIDVTHRTNQICAPTDIYKNISSNISCCLNN